MNIERIVPAAAGAVILSSLALARLHTEVWLWLTAFAGFNLLQSAFTGFCPLKVVLKAAGVKGAGELAAAEAG